MAVTPPSAALCDLSVVIVSWNTRQLLDDCLLSLYAGGGLEGLSAPEVWVVDNASCDNSAERVRDAYPETRLIANTENVGFARANNQALRQAAGRYLLLLNSDTIVPRGALSDLVRAMDKDPRAAVCSPLLLNADGSPQFCWARFPGVRSELAGRLDLGQSPYPTDDYADPAKRTAMTPFAVDWVGGACFLVRAEAAQNVGLLDEAFFMYAEETDWCRRFAAANWKTLLVPSVTVTHLGGQSSLRVPIKTRTRMYRSALRYYRLAYGPAGALAPSALATARYGLFRLKAALAKK
jgi:hypothetical protein